MASNTPSADDKFRALRESGYTGGIDQNGNPADAKTQDILDALRDNT